MIEKEKTPIPVNNEIGKIGDLADLWNAHKNLCKQVLDFMEANHDGNLARTDAIENIIAAVRKIGESLVGVGEAFLHVNERFNHIEAAVRHLDDELHALRKAPYN